jgi:orotate phosphoribosyltransferase
MDDFVSRVREKSLLRGDFTLRSEKKSDVYLDVRRAYGDPRLLNEIVDRLIGKMDPHKIATCVVGYGFGGIPLASAMASRHGLNLTNLRDDPKSYGTQKQIEGYEPNSSDRVIIPDDVFTSGSSLITATEIIKPTRAQIISYGVVVNREEGNPSVLDASLFWLMTRTEMGL